MLDKNPNRILGIDFMLIQSEFSLSSPNIILCSNPFLKTEFLRRFIDSSDIPVFFLDFDLLYSGYVSSGLVENNDNVTIFRPNKTRLLKDLKTIVEKISNERIFLIIDSFNGLYNMFDELESIRFINAIIMLLSTVGKHKDSVILVSALARKNDVGNWIISPGGRHLVDSKKLRMYYLTMSDGVINLNPTKSKLSV